MHHIFNVQNSIKGQQWIERPCEAMDILTIRQKCGLSEILARILAGRQISWDKVDSFLNPTLKNLLPDPSHLKDMDRAVERIYRALVNKEKIAVFGDYDVDGATSSALLYRFFKMLGVEILIHIPDRIEEGYGPQDLSFAMLKQKGAAVVITVDCGTVAFAPIAYANSQGLDVIVIDHHAAEPRLPPAYAVINPNRLDQDSCLQQSAAVGVSFAFVVALNRCLRDKQWYGSKPQPNLISLLDLVALGTVCDVMPLHGVNRAFVKQGLKVMAQRCNLGLKVLSDVSGVAEKPTAYHLGFVLGPRINAGGRVGEAGLGSMLLRCDDELVCQNAAQKLNIFNDDRKIVEQTVLEQAEQQASLQKESFFIVVGDKKWHPGVIGIVAGRLKEKYGRPVCVISFDENGIGKGSGRSIVGVDLGALIHMAAHQELLIKGGGHPMAAGFSVHKHKMEEFHTFLQQKVKDLQMEFQTSLLLDGALTGRSTTAEMIHELELLAPYGMGNPSPKFGFGYVTITKTMILAQQHIKCYLKHADGTNGEAIAFRCVAQELGDFLLQSQGKQIHIAGSVNLNSWMGNEKPQIIIDDAACVT